MATIYIYRRALSSGARELADAVGGKRFRGRIRPIAEQVKAGDSVICWGEALPAIPGVKILNGAPIQNKYQDALALRAANVPTIETSKAKPAARPAGDEVLKPLWEEVVEAAEDFVEVPFARQSPVFIAGVKDFEALVVKLKKQMEAPVAVPGEWLPRVGNHVGGGDLLNPPAAPDYWVKKEQIVEEIRIHSFNGKSIRAGLKKPRAGVPQHAWVRSFDGGWSIIYDGFESKKAQRELAHSAVKALGLEFGAVDLGKLANGNWIVLEVNRAPGNENGTTASYAEAIKNWVAGR